MKSLPNLLTAARLMLCLLMFAALMLVAGAIPGVERAPVSMGNQLVAFAFVAFVVAAVTDFLDGWLARKYGVESTLGAILDPIADKILVCGAIVGLLALGARDLALPGGLILFREFSVSALREVLAPRGLKLPVTFLAKTKTTVQLVALAAYLGLPLLAGLIMRSGGVEAIATLRNVMTTVLVLLWIAAAITVWTGLEYALAARRALAAKA
ncbi:MAG TPA: CDP-diacylglycerol--glycerol-3-phosphate 3-phosphatidyltransferase [Caulobacteraceae bacterium]|jgi:CDP-diacylglycerol--glycerol-3-phosphate 3-phosphatidyltransferase